MSEGHGGDGQGLSEKSVSSVNAGCLLGSWLPFWQLAAFLTLGFNRKHGEMSGYVVMISTFPCFSAVAQTAMYSLTYE